MQVDGNRPLAQRDLRFVHYGSRLDREVAAAVRAAVGHVSVTGDVGVRASAVWAIASFGPQPGFKPLTRTLLRRKQITNLNQRNAFAVVLAGCFVSHNSPSYPYL